MCQISSASVLKNELYLGILGLCFSKQVWFILSVCNVVGAVNSLRVF
jgi:hypothetical protein